MIITQVLKRVKEADFVRYINGQFLDKNNAEISVATEGGGGGGSGDNTQDAINAAAQKATPVDADKIPLTDSAASGLIKYFTLLNLKDLLVTYLKSLDFVRVNATKDLLSGTDVVVTQAATGMRSNYLAATGLTDTASGLWKMDVLLTSTTPAANAAVTLIIDYLDRNGTDMSGFMNAWQAGGTISIRSAASTDTSFAVLSIVSVADQTPDTYFEIPCLYIGGTTFVGGESCVIQYVPPTNVGLSISGAAAKATPVDDDRLALTDSAASHVLKYLTLANLKAAINTYLLTLGYTRIDSNGNLLGSNGLPVDGVNPIYAIASAPVTGIPELPAADSVTNGSVVALHPDCLVGAGANVGGILLKSYEAGNIWRPACDRALLFSKTFGTVTTPTLVMTSTTQAASSIFNVGVTPVIPAGLLYSGAKLMMTFRFRRIDTSIANPVVPTTLQCWMGTSATPTNNSIIWTMSLVEVNNQDVYPSPEMVFTSTTSLSSSRNGTRGGGGGISTAADLSTLIDTAADMNIAWRVVTTLDANESIVFYGYEIWMVAQ